MTIPACYYPGGRRGPVRRIRLSQVVGWHLEARGRAAYIVGIRPAREEPASPEDIACFRRAFPETTASDAIVRVLAALHREWGGR